MRGLDYYTRTLFEIKGAKQKLGAGDTLLGGGRYDTMVEDLGGPKTPALGFAAGLERLLIAAEPTGASPTVDAFIAPLGSAALAPALTLARELRAHNIAVEADTRGSSLKALLRRANSLGARLVLILRRGRDRAKRRRAQGPRRPCAGRGAARSRRRHRRRPARRERCDPEGMSHELQDLARLRRAARLRHRDGAKRRAAAGPAAGTHGAHGGGPARNEPQLKATIGSDFQALPPPEGRTQRSFHGYYEERKGDYRFRTVPPLYFEATRGLLNPLRPELGQNPDRESLIGLFYYRRRSQRISADVLFPFFWHVRDEQSYLTAIGPFVHQEGPTGHDNWLAPLFFAGDHKKDGGASGYLVVPPLLTYSQWSPESALTVSLPLLYFRNRSGKDVDAGIIPFYFHGDNGNTDGSRQTYTLIPPLLFYHSYKEFEQSRFTVAGPVITSSTPYRDVIDVVPFVFHIQGKPETGGRQEAHTTLFPFLHYGHTEDVSLVATPLFLYRKTHYRGHDEDANASTLITPVYSRLTTRNGASEMQLAGPVVPLFVDYVDKDIDQHPGRPCHSSTGTTATCAATGRRPSSGASRASASRAPTGCSPRS